MKKIVLLVSFFCVGINALDTRPFDPKDPAYTPAIGRLDKELQATLQSFKKVEERELQLQKKLLQMEEGRIYHAAVLDRRSDDKSPLGEDVEAALAQLEQRPEFQEYLSLVTKRDHYNIKMEGLDRVRRFAAIFNEGNFGPAEPCESQIEAMLIGLNSMKESEIEPYYPGSLFPWTKDLDKTQAEVWQELHGILVNEAFLRFDELQDICHENPLFKKCNEKMAECNNAKRYVDLMHSQCEEQGDCATSVPFKTAFLIHNKIAIETRLLLQQYDVLPESREVTKIMKIIQ
jgi:hypothetical protein